MISNIISPNLILDKDRCLKNINNMMKKVKKNSLDFRPHFKTHQSLTVANWFRNCGVKKITVSSVRMAEYFSEGGWNDITIAFPVNIREINKISKLAESIKLNLLIVDRYSLEYLEKNIKSPAGFFIEIDTGYNRTGVDHTNIDEIDNILNAVGSLSKMSFKGFLSHAGNTYKAGSHEGIISIHDQNLKKFGKLRNRYSVNWPELLISIGDTPACCLADKFEGINEIRPGNFVFFDLMQKYMGVCKYSDIAVVLASPVVSVSMKHKKIAIYGGGIHLSKEFVLDKQYGKVFGKIVLLNDNGRWENPVPDCFVSELSQEHGIIKSTDNLINNVKTGDLLGIIPVHSCLTANLMGQYIDLKGNVIDHMSG